jgi:hypothetical protein
MITYPEAYIDILDHHKTYHIGTDLLLDPIRQVPISMGDFQFNNGDYLTWCDILARLSQLFITAEMKSKLSMSTPTAVLCFPDYYDRKFKEEDQETREERIDFLISKMAPPTNGLVLSTYKVHEPLLMYDKYREPIQGINATWPFTTLYKWDMVDTWDKDKVGDYITFQKTELASPLRNDELHMAKENQILEYLESKNIKIKFIDYSMDTEEIYNSILHAKTHISYFGSSYWLACYLNTPIVAYGYRTDVVCAEYGFSDLFGRHSSGASWHDHPGACLPVTYQEDEDGYKQFLPKPVPPIGNIQIIGHHSKRQTSEEFEEKIAALWDK